MGINRQVFASNPERENHYKLSRQWGDRYRIYHNLPFLSVFNAKDLTNPEKLASLAKFNDPKVPADFSLDDADFNRLKKTSIDYTLCSKDDHPILCIEFDGLKDGFNVGTEYHFDGPPDPWRELITSLKLKVAHGSMFPFFVVGFKEFRDLSEDVKLTMVDGIIGEVLASKATQECFSKGFVPEAAGWSQEEFDRLQSWEQDEVVQDWVMCVEIECELKHNPISVRVASLAREIRLSCECKWLSYPDADKAKSLQERALLLDRAIFNGCRCELHGGIKVSNGKTSQFPSPLGPISATVWLPHFKTPGCGTMLELVENLSKLVALETARKRMATS